MRCAYAIFAARLKNIVKLCYKFIFSFTMSIPESVILIARLKYVLADYIDTNMLKSTRTHFLEQKN